ncbi:hypothetical protein [Variovorax sp. V15]|uniref:hypothetical protein n=1 Tax=Variovorax sp. V15 TaxID=3065952 RepID=UPI0034E8B0BA
MSILKAPIDLTVDLVARGLNTEVRGLLRERLHEVAKELIESICKEAAENLVSKVSEFHRIDKGTTEVVVVFNGKKVD